MNKVEFMNKVASIDASKEVQLSEQDYRDIEFVYVYHPCIDAVRGKEQIAYLYCEFGMCVIKDMMATAVEAQLAETEMQAAYKTYLDAKQRYEKLKKGSK